MTSHSLREKIKDTKRTKASEKKKYISSAHILANTMANKLLHTKLSKSYKINQKILNTHHDYEPDWLNSARQKNETSQSDERKPDVTRKLSSPDCTRNELTVPSKSTHYEEENRSIVAEERKPERSISSSRIRP